MAATAIILAGGFGTRLQSVVHDLPKPMAPVVGRPFLDYQLSYLRHHGFEQVIISTGHLSEKISSHYGERFNDMALLYSHETQPLGTGGGIRLAMQKKTENEYLVINGDSFFEVPLGLFRQRHAESAADASLALRAVSQAARFGKVRTDDQQRIISFSEKSQDAGPGLINGGVYMLNRQKYLEHTPENKNFSIEKDFFQSHLNLLRICGFSFEGFFIDIGIPEDYSKAQNDFKGFKY